METSLLVKLGTKVTLVSFIVLPDSKARKTVPSLVMYVTPSAIDAYGAGNLLKISRSQLTASEGEEQAGCSGLEELGGRGSGWR